MDSFKEQWNLEMAMEVLKSETVHSQLWMEAVQWLLFYGPEELRDLVAQASNTAFHECFPELRPAGVSPDGQACYAMTDLADAVGLSEEEIVEKLHYFEKLYGIEIIGPEKVTKIQ